MPENIKNNVPLAPYTTLGVGGNAEYFGSVSSLAELEEIVAWAEKESFAVTILGGGSNVLVPDSGVSGVVVHMEIMGIRYTTQNSKTYVTAGAGVILDVLIEELVMRGYWGLENLSAIPGTVGAVPIQNVGAYGVEAKDVITAVTLYDAEQHTVRTLTNAECAFGYRDSLFKQKSARKYYILEVTFLVTTEENPKLTYKDLSPLHASGMTPALRDIRNAIVEIRSGKFPDWKTIGTAGSFFKNPHITEVEYARLTNRYPDLPGYRTQSGVIKIPLGWVLEHVCKLKGYREESIGLYEKQALVLVCARGTSATSIEIFSQKIIDHIFETTGISVEREVTTLR